jgi:hypothetical protein
MSYRDVSIPAVAKALIPVGGGEEPLEPLEHPSRTTPADTDLQGLRTISFGG